MPRFASNIIYLFNDLPLLDRISASVDAGFEAVECQSPYDVPAADVLARLDDCGTEMVLINALMGDADAGERGLGIFPDRRDEFRDLTARSIDYAAAINCPRLHVLAGILPDGLSSEEARATFTENLVWAADQGRDVGVRILTEPLNGIDNPGYFLTNAEQARPILADAGHDNLYLQYDLYHAGKNGEDVVAGLRKHFDVIDHMQVAGVPDRNEPDTGTVDFRPAFEAIDELGYTGWVGAEYAPKHDTLTGLDWAGLKGG